MDEVILIDGKMLGYRAHFSHLTLRNMSHQPTGMLHGFLKELLCINNRRPEASMVICWDGSGETWRHLVYKSYKANRKLNPEWKNMKSQKEALLPMLRRLGFRVYEIDGVEADDVIGILSTQLNVPEVRIYSTDKDMYQLVRPGVYVWPKFDQPLVRMKEVEQWLGAPLQALTEIKAMAGDTSDNLKGLPGVGLVTARRLWKEGLRMDNLSNGKRWSKYSVHFRRLKMEHRLAQIIRSADDEVWSEKQRYELHTMVRDVDASPGRNQKVGMLYKKEFYEFLGQYELNELFGERHRILSLP